MKITTDHKEIREWVRKYNGKPEILNHDEAHGDSVGLRIDFPGSSDEAFLSSDHPPEDIPWERFFRIFDDQGLAFEYSDDSNITDPSSSFHFIRRDIAEEEESS